MLKPEEPDNNEPSERSTWALTGRLQIRHSSQVPLLGHVTKSSYSFSCKTKRPPSGSQDFPELPGANGVAGWWWWTNFRLEAAALAWQLGHCQLCFWSYVSHLRYKLECEVPVCSLWRYRELGWHYHSLTHSDLMHHASPGQISQGSRNQGHRPPLWTVIVNFLQPNSVDSN